jgi:probable F420-dependent oxidoreductase
MELGVTIWLTEYSIGPSDFAIAAEERGFESILLPEHSNIPVSRHTPFPGGGELPEQYKHMLDPFVALAAMAAVTTTIKLGTAVCLVVQRDPIQTAKEVASLDLVSGGRVLFGVGAGWNVEEMANHGTDPDARFRLLRERVEAMRRLWSDDVAAYEGDLVRLAATWQWPKPVQRPPSAPGRQRARRAGTGRRVGRRLAPGARPEPRPPGDHAQRARRTCGGGRPSPDLGDRLRRRSEPVAGARPGGRRPVDPARPAGPAGPGAAGARRPGGTAGVVDPPQFR